MIFFVFGLLSLGTSCIRWLWGNWKRKVCTEQAIGVVSGFKRAYVYQNKGRKQHYRTMVTYSVLGVEYTMSGEKRTSFYNFDEGQKVTVLYDPSKPQRSYILEEGRDILRILTPLAFGVMAMIMAGFLHMFISE
jgi:Protein of unknown function (DUF3592).